MSELLEDIRKYWTKRAKGYSEYNQGELSGEQREKWRQAILAELPDKPLTEIHLLDVGTGPGFFAIILAEAGIQVTAVDYTEEMLKEAKANAGELSEKIHFQQMDAQNLEFPDGTFDVVITRNVTWNLEHPVRAYQEWYRVLKKDGVLLNFDANWYRYLCDEELRKGYEEDRKKTKEQQVEDYYEGTDIAEMERIAAAVPLTEILRPAWDLHVMGEIGFQDCRSDETVNERILSRADQINGESTPMFLVTGRK